MLRVGGVYLCAVQARVPLSEADIILRSIQISRQSDGEVSQLDVYIVPHPINLSCLVTIAGYPEGQIERLEIFGVDRLQSLELALGFIRVQIDALRRDWTISWPDGSAYTDTTPSRWPIS